MQKNQTGYSIHSMEFGPMDNFVYLIHDHASDTAAIVDPAWEVEKILDLAREKNIQITDVLLTHSHNDHVNGLQETLKHYDARVHLLQSEEKFSKHNTSHNLLARANIDRPTLHHGGDQLKIGESVIDILHTPGHTPGSACYHIGNDLIAGDTLFVFGCGRCDMTGGDPEQMFHTLNKMKTELPASTILHPGHNYAPQTPTSDLETQCHGNPFLHFDKPTDFVKYRMHVHDKIRDIPYNAVTKQQARDSIT